MGRTVPPGMEPLPPRRKWRAILVATLLLVPGYWAMMVGLVSFASDKEDAPAAAPFIAFGLALIPFVFVALAFLSEHPRAPAAAAKAMGLAVVVGIPASALAADALTGFVAGVGAGGIAAMRMDQGHTWKARAVAVLAAAAYAFLTVRAAPDLVLLIAPVLPFTVLGVADHLSERRSERAPHPSAREPTSTR
ncbi:MAG: hypothetical protein ACE14W_06515 [Candidatus Velamenicoccus archaeovorus]